MFKLENFQETVSFIRNQFKNAEGFIPLHAPGFFGNEKKYLEECIDSTYVSSVGKFVDMFEDITAKYTGAKRAVVCVNGTNALYLALIMSGVKQNDEVLTQPLTFIATVNAISYCNASPVFIDVDKDTMGLSPEALEHFLKNNTELKSDGCFNRLTKNKISACVPMHTFGFPCRIDEIAEICNRYQIPVVEDAAESIGSFYKGKHTGTFGNIGVLSFNGNKTITTGGGGMLLFTDEETGKKAKHITTQAKVPHRWEFVHDEIGYNYRMPNLNAALGLAQMENLEIIIEKKRKLAANYKQFFANIGVSFASEIQEAKANYWLNAIILKDKDERDRFLQFTNDNNVMTRPAWRLMNKLEMFKHFQTGSVENAQWLEDRIVNIPSSVIL